MSALKQNFSYNVSIVLPYRILKAIRREGNPLNNYLSMLEDLFFDAKELMVRSIKFKIIL